MKKIALLCVCVIALTVSSGYAGMQFGAMPGVRLSHPQKNVFLTSQNSALKKALDAHNLLNSIPALDEMAQSCDMLERSAKLLEKGFKNLRKCGEMALGGNYKNSSVVLDKAISEYRVESKKVDKQYEAQMDPDSILPPSVAMREELVRAKRKVSRGVFANIAKNPAKYGASLVDKQAQKKLQVNVEDDSNKFNVLEEVSKMSDTMDNMALSKEDILNARKQMTDAFKTKLLSVGLDYTNVDLMQRANLIKAKEDLLKLKKQRIEEAEAYIVKLDEQDAKYPKLAEKRAYRSANKKTVMAGLTQQYPELMQELVQIDQMTPQQQQKLIVAALKKDMNGTVYLTETNIMDVDRKMGEMEAHKDMMNHLKKMAQDIMPTDTPDFDFSVCKA